MFQIPADGVHAADFPSLKSSENSGAWVGPGLGVTSATLRPLFIVVTAPDDAANGPAPFEAGAPAPGSAEERLDPLPQPMSPRSEHDNANMENRDTCNKTFPRRAVCRKRCSRMARLRHSEGVY